MTARRWVSPALFLLLSAASFSARAQYADRDEPYSEPASRMERYAREEREARARPDRGRPGRFQDERQSGEAFFRIEKRFRRTAEETRPLVKELKELAFAAEKHGLRREMVERRSLLRRQLEESLRSLEGLQDDYARVLDEALEDARAVHPFPTDGRGSEQGPGWAGKARFALEKMTAVRAELAAALVKEAGHHAAMEARGKRRFLMRLGAAAALLLLFMGGAFLLFRRLRRPKAPPALPDPGTPVSLAAVPTTPPAPTPPMAEGAVLGGNFRIVRELGRGGMGVVYEAEDTTLKRKVAIKRMREEIVRSKRELDFFLLEAQMVASLKHPNLVEIYSIVKEDGEVFLVFEYVEGHSLDRYLEKHIRFPLANIFPIVRQVGGALDYAHSRKVIHRDLKPSNIVLDPRTGAKVMDFGIAYQAKKTVAKMTRAESWGTPPYMAPEQEIGSVGRESDLFSLGVCFYEMLTGRLPFEGPNYLAQKREMRFTPPTQVTPGLPETVDALVARALDADPARRFHSGAEFAAATETLR